MNRIYILLLFLLFVLPKAQSQNSNITINGVVKDEASGETLIGATVELMERNTGTVTNEYGFYAISLLPGLDSVTLRYRYVGYDPQVFRLLPDQNRVLNVQLKTTGKTLEAVVVTANGLQEKIRSTEMSVATLSIKEAKALPVLFGEVDILKTLQLKPGINAGSEGSTGLFVRGGSNDQNLMVLDEAIVYNANHLFGFFSTFNSDAIKDVKIWKGGYPAQYGGRLSSVLDIRLKEGNNQQFHGTGGIGIIASRLTIEGPIVKNKGSFIISGRRTYVDLLTRQVNNSNKNKADYNPIPDYYFYDLNAKVNYEFSPKDHLYLSGYFGKDVFGFSNDNFNFDFNWGNTTGTARWNHVFSPQLFCNTTFTYSDYQYNISNRFTGFSFSTNSQIKDANLKLDFYKIYKEKHTIRFGGNLTYHQFVVGRLKAGSDDGKISFSAGQDFDGTEFGAYISDDWSPSDKLKINPGLRISGFSNDGKTYFGIEPRIGANYSVNQHVSLKASYSRMYQYIHLISNSGISLPTDIWYPSSPGVKPQSSDQVAIGGSWLIGDNVLITNEYYYKWLYNQLDFKDGAQLFANRDLEETFAFGKGRAYGMELEIEKKNGKLTGWIGYTLAWVKRGDFKDIMDGRYFPPRYDRRHNLTVVAIYELSRRLSVSGSFVYGSGDIAWLPQGRYVFQDVGGAQNQPIVPIYGDRNTFRLPSYNRLDLGLVWKFFPKWGSSDLTVSVYNAYDRRNPYFIYLAPEYETVMQNGVEVKIPKKIAAKQVSLFPILPSLTYNFTF